MRILRALILSFFFFVFFPKDLYAQACINGGVTCCGLTSGRCESNSYFPGYCDSNCKAKCPSNGFAQVEMQDANCYWQGGSPPPGGGGGGFICPFDPTFCPEGTVRGTTLLGSQCESYQCGSNVGSAQQVGSCCNFYTPPRECSELKIIVVWEGAQCQRLFQRHRVRITRGVSLPLGLSIITEIPESVCKLNMCHPER